MINFNDDLNEIRKMIARGAFAGAGEALRQLVNADPGHATARALLGHVELRLGHREEAVAMFEQASSLPNVTRSLIVEAGHSLFEAKCWVEALGHFQKALEIDKRDPLIWERAGCCFAQLGRLDLGEAYLRNALRLQPASGKRLAMLGHVLSKQGRSSESCKMFELALSCDPKIPLAWNGLGLESLRDGSLHSALGYFRNALSVSLKGPLSISHHTKQSDFGGPQTEALMWRTLSYLAEAQLHVFPTSGTLLGLVRDGRLLPFDKDLDFGLPFEELEAASSCLLAHGWLKHDDGMRFLTPVSFYHPEFDVSLDLCGFLNDVEHSVVISGFWQDGQPWHLQRVTEYPAPLNLVQEQRPEGMIWALQDPECWLSALYGPDWKTPDPDFDTVVGAYNLRSFSLLTQCYGFMRISQYLVEGRLGKALATTRHCLRHLPDDAVLLEAEFVLSRAISDNNNV